MTYGNVQEIRVSAGPLQQLLGLADVEVHAAGSEGDKHGGGHIARLEGLANANDIRDLIVERLRHYRDAGLGDSHPVAESGSASELAAARLMLTEVRALRACLSQEAAR